MFIAFCCEGEEPGVRVVVLRCEFQGGPAPDGEVAAQQEPEPQVGRRGVEYPFGFELVDTDVPWPGRRVAAQLLIDFWCAVVLPQPSEYLANRSGTRVFGADCVAALSDYFVRFDGVGCRDFLGQELTNLSDEGLCGLDRVEAWVSALDELGVKYLGDVWTHAFFFGWASSLCSPSNFMAARWLMKDLRFCLPLTSRQSA